MRSLSTPPFSANTKVQVILASDVTQLSEAEQQSLSNIVPIFEANRSALERELGTSFEFVTTAKNDQPRWIIGPAHCNPSLQHMNIPASDVPYIFLNREQQLLICDAKTAAGIWETFGLLRSLSRFSGGILRVTDAADIDEAVQRVMDEVGDCYPAFDLRGLDWDEICQTYIPKVKQSSEPVFEIQTWLAELQDTHTWVRPSIPLSYMPYELWVENNTATFCHVPSTSRAWQIGVRPGFQLLRDDISECWQRTAATAHARPFVTGRRLIQQEIGQEQEFTAVSPSGHRISWTETVPTEPWDNLIEWRKLLSGVGYLKINAWRRPQELEESIDMAFDEFKDAPGIIIDLRGNGGGDMTLALRFRDRFLRREETMGWIQYSTSHRVLSEPERIIGIPAETKKRWNKPVRFLTDPLTYSASEDALLGLQGLAHVEVWGEPSGGGSGRVRPLRLIPGWTLTISTALTYDRHMHCIENQGIPVDRYIKPDRFSGEDRLLEMAAQDW